MNQKNNVPSGTENFPANNYRPKPTPGTRPRKFTKYAYVVKNKVAWDRMKKKYVIVEGKGTPETLRMPLLHKDPNKAYQDACKICDWSPVAKEARTLYIVDGSYVSPNEIKRMRKLL